jgi:DNA-binding NarL/FixJ family response regulator
MAYSALFSQQHGVRIVGMPTSKAEAFSICRAKHPDATIIDTSLTEDSAFSLAHHLLDDRLTSFVVLLGDEPDDEWNQKAAVLPNAAYLSRTESFAGLLGEIYRKCGFAPPVGPQCEPLVAAPTQPADAFVNSPHFATLTPRERDVVQLLVDGNSVRACAEMLGLAVSTVDNHKVHLMRKLNVHKTVDLVRLAIRKGLVSP